jgi:hypothetical protein
MKNANLFAENSQKSQERAIITLTPELQLANSAIFSKRPQADPAEQIVRNRVTVFHVVLRFVVAVVAESRPLGLQSLGFHFSLKSNILSSLETYQ